MDTEEELANTKKESENAMSDQPTPPGSARKSRTLKEATSHLKQEALRRYREKHANDPEFESEMKSYTPSSEKDIPTAAVDTHFEPGMTSTEDGAMVDQMDIEGTENKGTAATTGTVDTDVKPSISGNIMADTDQYRPLKEVESDDTKVANKGDKIDLAAQKTEPTKPEPVETTVENGVTQNADSRSQDMSGMEGATAEGLTRVSVKGEGTGEKVFGDGSRTGAPIQIAAKEEDENVKNSEQPQIIEQGETTLEEPSNTDGGQVETTQAETSDVPVQEEPEQLNQSADNGEVEASLDQQTASGEVKQEEPTEDKQETEGPEVQSTDVAGPSKDPQQEVKDDSQQEVKVDLQQEVKDDSQQEVKDEAQQEAEGQKEQELANAQLEKPAEEVQGQIDEAQGQTQADQGQVQEGPGQGESQEKGQIDEQASEKQADQEEQSQKVSETPDGSGDGQEAPVIKTEQDTTQNLGKVTGGDKNQNAAEDKDQSDEEQDEKENAKKSDDEDEQKEEEKEKKEEKKPAIPEDFFYNFEEFSSKPSIMENSGLPEDMLKLQHSFGYDCKRRANLFMLDQNTLMFIAGNLVQLLNTETKEQTYIRSSSGGGIGALAVHPSRKYFAVAEKGVAPNINIFEYPTLKLYRILRGGTEKTYSSVGFSPDGELLTSVGGEPDFMLTVWDWKEEMTMLRSKAFSQDVFRATFSTELEGQLTTAGTGHIRFWKMADTFTGLKLQGELGRFGRTEISDIDGYVELPDGKVLSGSEWGNMLLWDGGLIKVEITRKNKKSCHQGAIQQILLDEGELMTIGVDGNIRMWDFETIDTADSTDETGLFEMEPMNELRVSSDTQLRSIVKSVDDDNEPTIWYAQDANGGIWRLDLSFSHTSLAPEKVMTYHAGPIKRCDSSPISHLLATIGEDNTVRVFDYVQQKQLCEGRYTASGTCLVWAPQIVDPKGSTLFAGFTDGVLRMMTVTHFPEKGGRRHKGDECELALKHVLKPHKGAVTAIAIDSKGEMLATGSNDSTVFFFNIGSKELEPIGFVELPAAVRSMQWSPDKFSKAALLVFCEEGNVVEIQAPAPGAFDTAHSFKISGLAMRTFTFRSIKSRLRHEEELERNRIEEEERKRREEAERRKRIERGLETESDQGSDEEEEAKPVQEDWKPYIPKEPSPILHGFYSEEGKFWLSMGDFDAGYLYECKFMTDAEKATIPEQLVGEPIRTVPVLESDDVPISVIQFSKSGQQAVFGMENGMIRLQQLENKSDLSDLGPYWSLSMHDNNYGHVTSIATSFDGKMLLTVGEDGNFFKFGFMDEEKLEEKIKENKAKIPSARKAEERERHVDDIDDVGAYSIEDAKQKAEHDKMMKQAEEKKRDVRRKIAKLRRQFKTVLEKNESLPKHVQLEKREFEMDREIKMELEKHTQEKIDIVRKELAWESEKHRIALEKLRKRFKDVVECERIVLKAFLTPHEVSSFRANKLSDDFYNLKAEFERKRTMYSTKDDMTRDPTRDLGAGQLKGDDSGDGSGDKADDSSGAKVVTSLKGSMGERITKALQKVEEKKKKRAARRAQWEDLYIKKPDDDYEDPTDVSAIKEAKENMGDYKLKTAADYVVPDHLRMNVEKARGRLLVLKDLIHEYKYDFNVRLLALRDKKIRIIEEIRSHVNKLQAVQSNLVVDKHKPIPRIPEMHMEEQPEKQLEYTREMLIKFKQDMESQRQQEAKEQAGSSGFGGGFGGFGGAGESKFTLDLPRMSYPEKDKHVKGVMTSVVQFNRLKYAALLRETSIQVHGSSPMLAGKRSSLTASRIGRRASSLTGEEVELSPLEKQIQLAEEIRLTYDQDDLLNKIDALLKNFDAELRLLRHDKFELDIVMKNADLRQVTLFEEFVLLKEYEKREDVLAAKVTGKQQEKLEMQNKILDVQGKMDVKKKDIEKLQEKERNLHASFLASLGDNNKFAEYLTKVFKKKIKRTKKKTTEGEGSDDDSDEDSDDESDWEESDEESDEEAGGYDLDVCPAGCDQTLYDNTCQLREKRLDNEEALAEEKKNSDTMKKEVEGLGKKARVIDGALKTAQNDLEAFQLEKQQKLNELDVVVTLKLNQIQYMINNVLPQDLSQTLVFESIGVLQLQHRIKELEHEKFLQKKHMRESRKKHVQLIKDRKVFEEQIVEMDETCNEMMISKFGRIIDLEKLETVTVNRNIEELKEKCRFTEIQCAEELSEWDVKIAEKRDEITNLIRDNTMRLEQLNMLMVENKDLQKSLDSRQKNLGEEYTGQRKADLKEKQRLIQLVQLQASEIDALKEEIMLLSRKGGHILPPAQPPLPQSPTNMHNISH